MKTFKDISGRTWNIAITVDSIRRVRSMADVDLLSIVKDKGELHERLTDDPVLIVDVLWALCKPAADESNVSPETFAAGLAGDTLELATLALLSDLVDFFPQARRKALEAVLTKVRQAEEKAMQRAIAKIQAIDLDAMLREFENSSTNVPAASELTQAP